MKLFSFVLASALFLVLGCGGSAEDGDVETTNPDFVGHWLGDWQSSGSGGAQSGTVDLTIAASGKVIGTVETDGLGTQGQMSGTLDREGSLSATYEFSGSAPVSAVGTLVLQQNGHLGGSVQTFADGQQIGTSTVDLIKQ